MRQVTIQFRLETWGDPDDLQKRHALEDAIDELLGEEDLGEVDGGDIGSGTMNIYCFVEDPDEAVKQIKELLRERGQLDDAIIAVATHDEDDTEEIPDDVVVWPEDFEGEFSVF